MHDITIYFVGGDRVTLKDCSDEFTNEIVKWLDRDSKETYKIDITSKNRTKVLRKELILFIDVD